jgi:hypothetical protein
LNAAASGMPALGGAGRKKEFLPARLGHLKMNFDQTIECSKGHWPERKRR